MAQVDRHVLVNRATRQLTRNASNMGLHVTFEEFLDRFEWGMYQWAAFQGSEAEQLLDAMDAVLFRANHDVVLRNQLEAERDVRNPVRTDLRVFRFFLDYRNLATLTGADHESARMVTESLFEDPQSDTAYLLMTGQPRAEIDEEDEDDQEDDEVWDPQGDPEWYIQRRRDEFKRANPNAIAPVYRTTDPEDLSERQREAMARALEKYRKGPSRAAAASRARRPNTKPKKKEKPKPVKKPRKKRATKA